MRRFLCVFTALAFAMASPAFAQSGPQNVSTQPVQNGTASSAQPLLLDGQDAMAQEGSGPSPLLVGLGVAVGLGAIIWAISASKKSSSP